MRKIERIEPTLPQVKPLKKVAAYARVSVETERLMHSLSAQVSYYSELIQSNPEWQYAGVYADSFISGTSIKHRGEFQRMIEDCEKGKIDIILTKSISRFSRNTVDLLSTVRHLKNLGIEVRFEKENINSAQSSGEIMLSILASCAQEESVNMSANIKWSFKKRFAKGKPAGRFNVYGYRWEGDNLMIVPHEAEVVKRIFQNFMDGKSRLETERELTAEGITTRKGCCFHDYSIRYILTNGIYTGDLLLQKYYIDNPLSKKQRVNNGELEQFLIENHHEPIIDKSMFEYVQNEILRRRELGVFANKAINTSCLTAKIKCGVCGKNYCRSVRCWGKNKHNFWRCKSHKQSHCTCKSPHFREDQLFKVCAVALKIDEFDENIFRERIEKIIVISKNELQFHFFDGTIKNLVWEIYRKSNNLPQEYINIRVRSESKCPE